MKLEQSFQQLRGDFTRAQDAQPIAARVDGTVVHASQPLGRLRMTLHQQKLRVDLAQGPYAALRGLAFARSSGDTCR